MIEGKKTAGRPRNSYVGQIKCDAKVKTFKELKEKVSNRLGFSTITLYILLNFF